MEKTNKTWNRIAKGIILFCILANVGIIFVLATALQDISEKCDIKYRYYPLDNDFVVNTSAVTNISQCANMSALDTSMCLNSMFLDIFEYNSSNDYEYENFSQVDEYIRRYGGDCHESATWFKFAASELGHYSSYVPVTMAFDNSTYPIIRYMHSFAVIADLDAYCVMDQGFAANCYEFESNQTNPIKISLNNSDLTIL